MLLPFREKNILANGARIHIDNPTGDNHGYYRIGRGLDAAGNVAALMIFNLGIALPVMLLGGIIALGMSPEQVDRFRNQHRVAIRLITGFTLLALALLIYWQMI
jgi:hypothetical protein